MMSLEFITFVDLVFADIVDIQRLLCLHVLAFSCIHIPYKDAVIHSLGYAVGYESMTH